jgi:hypothetical protein
VLFLFHFVDTSSRVRYCRVHDQTREFDFITSVIR